MTEQRFIIVGASLAGAKAAQELRERGFEGQLVLVGSESEVPYERPPLTKDYLRGESEREKAYVHDRDFYGEHNIELLSGVTATKIDPDASRVTLDNGSELQFDRLLLTTGAEPRTISVPGADLDGVFYLRTLGDSETLKQRLEAGSGRVAVIGGGWIGSEFAASARQKGLDVALIDPLEVPAARLFGDEVGTFYRDVHGRHGVELMLGDGVESFEGNGTVSRVKTTSGKTVECDFVVVGIGVVPRVGLAKDAGIAIDNGIVVDEHLVSSAPNVYAAGDVANAWHPFFERQIRVEHWANALNQGPAAARAMLGDDAGYDRLPYFFSDQYDVGMEYSGYATDWDEVVFRGDHASGEFVAFWLKDKRVLAGMNVNVWDVNEHVQALIRSRREVDTSELADPDTSLESMAGASTDN
jgi:3-phenylpropionate/trans-cinnamate dioxygenase ferredoxin reductase component